MASENERRATNHIRRLMSIGQYPDGARLPTERDLAVELDIGRGPIRRALRTLEAEGKISRHVGQGTFVGNHPARTPPTEATIPSVLTQATPDELLETRLTIEPRLAAMAAMRASDEDIDYLKLAVTRSETADDWAAWERWDSTFHRTIALATNNTFLTELVEIINRLRRDRSRQNNRPEAADPNWRPQLVKQHRAIVEAIAARDPGGAAKAMRDHLRGVEERLFGDQEDIAEIISRV